MKKFCLLIVCALLVGCLLLLGGCERLPQLQTPSRMRVEQTTLTLKWGEVPDARLYTVQITSENGESKEFLVSKTNYSLSFLDAGTYTIQVKANGKENTIEDSAWSEKLTFIREQEPGLVMTLNKTGTAYEVTDKGIATGHIVIPDTYRGKPVTSIGKKAFFNKTDVTGVTFGANIESIGEFAFGNCSYLQELVLPESLRVLGANAFASCRLLAGELVIPEGVEEISSSAFAYCGQLTGLRLGGNVHSIGINAFTECTGLTSVQMPESLRYIYDYAFAGCTGLTELNLNNGVEAIGPYAFAELVELSHINLPDSVKNIGEGAFYNCTKLEQVNLGTGLEMIDVGAFSGTALWANATENEVYADCWFLGLKDTGATVLNLRADTVGMANYALYNNQKLTNVYLPESLQIIGNAAFAGSKIATVELGGGVKTIGEQAFAECKVLVTVNLGDWNFEQGKLVSSSLQTIGNYAFMNCENLVEITIPDCVEVIGSYAFKDTGMWKAPDENGVIYAGNWAVGFAEMLTGEVNLKNGTVGVSNYAFYQCEGLTGIRIPNSVKRIGRAAFYKCKELTSVTLPNMLEVIEEYTFYHCDKLQLFELPPVLRVIGRSAFYKCGSAQPEGLEEGMVQESLEDIFTIPG